MTIASEIDMLETVYQERKARVARQRIWLASAIKSKDALTISSAKHLLDICVADYKAAVYDFWDN